MKKAIFIGAAIVAVQAVAGIWLWTRSKAATVTHQSYEFATIAKRSVESVVSSTGTLAPLSRVNSPNGMPVGALILAPDNP